MTARNIAGLLGLAAIAAALVLVAGQGSGLAQEPAPAPAVVAQQDVLMVGDSLAVGTMPYLDAMLPSEVNLTWDAVDGRTTPQGIDALALDLREVEPEMVVVSLGSNDGPDPERFTARIRRLLDDLSPTTCVAWFSIVRPPRKGRYGAMNRALRAEARRDRRLIVINWDSAVRRGTVVLPDGLHADAEGYRYRSAKIAQAVHSGCRAV